MLTRFLFLILVISSIQISGQIQSPSKFFGYQLGDNFSRYHQVVEYFKHLEQNSSEIKLVPYGKTNEGRLLQLVFISNTENLKNIEDIRNAHMQDSNSGLGMKNNDKVIVWLSYSVHGNESSSTEASMKRSEERRVGKECRSRWSPYH